MANNIYIGNRYVPIFADPVEWDNLRSYEPLTIVTYQGTSYTSKKTVPVGIALNNTEYWVATGNYNAQVAQLTDDVNTLSGNVTSLESDLSDLNDEIELMKFYSMPEMFGAVGDGVTDDSVAILSAFNDAKANNKILVLSKNYAIGTAITLDFVLTGGVYGRVDIICSGSLVMNNTLKLQHGAGCNISLRLNGGSLNTGYACTVCYFEYSNIDMVAEDVNCTAFKVGGTDGPLHWCTLSMSGFRNYCSLKHGDVGTAGTVLSNQATGKYTKILDNGATKPVTFNDVYDINIEYFEGHYSDNTHVEDAFVFNGGSSIHLGVFAQGGEANHLLKLNACGDVTVDYIFMMGETYSSPYPTKGIGIVNSDLSINEMRGLYLSTIIDNDNSSKIRVSIDLSKSYTSYLTNANVYTFIEGISLNIKDSITAVNGVPITYIGCDVVGDEVVISGETTLSSNISAYGNFIGVNSLSAAINSQTFLISDSSGNVYPLYYNSGTSYIKSRKAISSGTTLFLTIKFKRVKS